MNASRPRAEARYERQDGVSQLMLGGGLHRAVVLMEAKPTLWADGTWAAIRKSRGSGHAISVGGVGEVGEVGDGWGAALVSHPGLRKKVRPMRGVWVKRRWVKEGG